MHTTTVRPVGPEVSRLGLGCISMTGTYGPADPHEAAATLLEALGSGVTLFDTGDFYGGGANEELLGQTLAPHRDRVVLATRTGVRRTAEGLVPAGSYAYLATLASWAAVHGIAPTTPTAPPGWTRPASRPSPRPSTTSSPTSHSHVGRDGSRPRACKNHDICYWGGTHGYPFKGKRADCDWTFYLEMSAACRAAFSWVTDPRQSWCLTQASAYYAAVRAIGGSY
ncbi:aldo/keto reductase [Microbispora sp. GKU 823]|uniref:aldo/keto reductase n=1 Tax=Microbispora sp. GKU 823 TaxID=1652100 RepID=UPI001C4E0972|nr:aldo/keto reductase [Microbispora sp. GKU 823]